MKYIIVLVGWVFLFVLFFGENCLGGKRTEVCEAMVGSTWGTNESV